MSDRELINMFEKAVKINYILEEISDIDLSLNDIPDLRKYADNMKRSRIIVKDKNNVNISSVLDKNRFGDFDKELIKEENEIKKSLCSKPSIVWKVKKITDFCSKYDLQVGNQNEYVDIEALKILNFEREKQCELRFILSGHTLEYMREEVCKTLKNKLN